jgi:Type II CAAX prenyl endopeptidase Rce1-like
MEPRAAPAWPAGRQPRLRLWALLVAAAALAYVATAPFLATVVEALLRRRSASISVFVVLVAQGIQAVLLSTLFAWIGVVCAPRVGLDAPVFRRLAEGRRREAARQLSSVVAAAALVGIGTGIALSLFTRGFQSRLPKLSTPSVTFSAGAATAVYAGVVEELDVRWGVLSAVLWLARRAGMRDGFPVANVAAAILFGAAHLPLVAFAGAPLTAATVAFVVGGNALGGLIFGWLFRRRGLEAAMIAHAAADLWLHAVAPLLFHQ